MYWWILLGYPDAFTLRKGQFFPRAGHVVKYYREKKMNEKGKAWTQKDLATVLGFTEQTVRDMENRDVGLTYERRQFLSQLLDIPPILLGITTEKEVHVLLEKYQQANNTVVISTSSYTGHKLVVDPEEYSDQLAIYWQTYYSRAAHSAITDTFLRLDALYRELPHVKEGKDQIQTLLYRYHQFVSRILFDQGRYDEAIDHLDKALFFAEALMDEELIALTFKRRGWMYPYAGGIEKAVDDFEQAQKYKNLPYNLTASILLEAGDRLARAAKLHKEKQTEKQTTALALIDQAGKIIRAGHVEEDPHFLMVHLHDYHRHKAVALIQAGRNRDAVNELKLIDIKSASLRSQAMTASLQARAYLNAGKYERAAKLAEYALECAQKINLQVTIANIVNIYQQLHPSRNKDSPDIARLDYLLSIPTSE